MSPAAGTNAAPDASRLCRACGMCCNGVLHRTAVVRQEEVETLVQLGIDTEERAGGLCFSLPCPQHVNACCAIYPHRPHTCVHYQCELLRRHLSGELDLEEALACAERAHSLVEAIRRRLREPDSTAAITDLWQKFEDRHPAGTSGAEADSPEEAELWLDVATLSVYLNRNFLRPDSPHTAKGAR
ncbi:MAG TPA: YkgJ family cysteine cluster protein [Thermoanaerobaculia bacterium]|nr:YkgJ family cysteine cluster protein [Thermoanaerobaculia bacterium]